MPYKVDYLLRSPIGKASESFISLAANDADVVTAATDLGKARIETLGFGAALVFTRLEKLDSSLRPQYALPQIDWGTKGEGQLELMSTTYPAMIATPPSDNQAVDWASDIRGTSMRLNFKLAGGVINPQVATRGFFFGIPDIVASSQRNPAIITGTKYKQALDRWTLTAFDPWKSLLQSGGWARKGRNKDIPDHLIIGLTPGDPTATPPLFASVTLAGKTLGYAAGDRIQIKGRNNRRRGGRTKELNGFWQVFQVTESVSPPDTTTLFLVCTINLAIDICRKMGKSQRVVYASHTITGVSVANPTQRRRGV